MQGRRIPVTEGTNPYTACEKPGDYYGPTTDYTGGVPAVFFLLPCARDEGIHPSGRALRHVCMPPHVFTEEADGSLTIRESIGAIGPNGERFLWHGYLTAGEWTEC